MKVHPDKFLSFVSKDFSMKYLEHVFLFCLEEFFIIFLRGVGAIKDFVNSLTCSSDLDVGFPFVPV